MATAALSPNTAASLAEEAGDVDNCKAAFKHLDGRIAGEKGVLIGRLSNDDLGAVFKLERAVGVENGRRLFFGECGDIAVGGGLVCREESASFHRDVAAQFTGLAGRGSIENERAVDGSSGRGQAIEAQRAVNRSGVRRDFASFEVADDIQGLRGERSGVHDARWTDG